MASITRKQFEFLRYGFECARENVEVPDTRDAAVRTTQALFWLRALDVLLEEIPEYKSRRNRDRDGHVILGLIVARNAAAHGGSVTVWHTRGMTAPLVFPLTSRELHWAALEDIEAPPVKPSGELFRNSYAKHLAGKRVVITLNAVARWFDRYARDHLGFTHTVPGGVEKDGR